MPISGVSRRTALTAFGLLAVLAMLPILTVRLPPILDYPNHLARMHILAALPGNADLAKFYEVVWTPLPNLAFDATVPWLGRLIGVETAMRAMLGLTLLGLAGGCLALHRVTFGRWSLWPLAAFLVLYNRMLLWGFLNYLAALALTLWALAAWVALERAPWPTRVAVGMLFATAIYFGHLAAFGCYALAVVALAFAPRFSFVRLATAVATLLPAAFFFLLAPTSGGPTEIGYGNILRKLDLPVSIFDNYNRVFDGATFAVLLIAVIYGLARGHIVMDPRLRWCVVAVIVAFVAVPARLLSASGIDHRLPIAIALLFIAGADWYMGRNAKIVAASLLGLLVVRMAVVEAVWLKADRQYDRLRPALNLIDPGAAIAVASPVNGVQAGGIPLLHYPTLAIVARNAFVPTLFADPLQQPVQLTALALELATTAQPSRLWAALADGHPLPLAGYDALMITDPPPTLNRKTLPGTILFDAPRLILVRLRDIQP